MHFWERYGPDWVMRSLERIDSIWPKFLPDRDAAPLTLGERYQKIKRWFWTLRFWDRNGSWWSTGKDTHPVMTGFAIFLVILALLGWWQYEALYTKDFASQHSSPRLVISHLSNPNDWWRMRLTGFRGAVCILLGFFVAYPLGVLLALYGRLTVATVMIICILLSLAKLAVILFLLRTFDYNEMAIYAIGLWTSNLGLLAFGFFDGLSWVTAPSGRDEGAQMESATLDGANWWQLYTEIVLPQLLLRRITTTFIISTSVWTSMSYGEARVSSSIQGLGERMAIMVEVSSTMGHFYAVSLMLTLLSVLTWAIIATAKVIVKRVRGV